MLNTCVNARYRPMLTNTAAGTKTFHFLYPRVTEVAMISRNVGIVYPIY